jgi:hypothetical protein
MDLTVDLLSIIVIIISIPKISLNVPLFLTNKNNSILQPLLEITPIILNKIMESLVLQSLLNKTMQKIIVIFKKKYNQIKLNNLNIKIKKINNKNKFVDKK